MPNVPCYGCQNRQVGCHGKCELYKSWSAQHKEEKRVENAQKTYRGWVESDIANTVYKAKKRRAKI